MAQSNDVPEKYQHLLDNGYEFRFSDYIRRGWELFTADPWPLIGFNLLLVIGSIVVSFIPFIGSIGLMIISPVLSAGVYIYIDKIAKGQDRTFNDFFSAFPMLGQLFLGNFTGSILTGLGMLLLLLPGIYLAVAYTMVIPLITFAGIEFWPALETSRKVITKNWWSFFGFLFVMGLIVFSGVLLLGVGIFATIPLGSCMFYAVYEDIFGEQIDPMQSRIDEIGQEIQEIDYKDEDSF
ncbi:MAG: hypothetical protein SF052_06985 [Bacteroidia bacterium]|nr:hypothetical protein [Bacteroidia bacterium]